MKHKPHKGKTVATKSQETFPLHSEPSENRQASYFLSYFPNFFSSLPSE